MTRILTVLFLLSCTLHACQCNDAGDSGNGQTNSAPDCPDGEFPDGFGGCTDDPCASDPCRGGQECAVGDEGGPVCECPAGTHDEDGACVEDTACMENSCSGHGECSAATGVVLCECEAGWAPPNCADCDEENGYHADGVGGCTTDVCQPNPCTTPGRSVCVAEGADWTCECDPGTHPAGDECVMNEMCTPDTCNGHGACDNSSGVAVCECDPGYGGGACGSCDVAGGYHDDGMGGCTMDPCLPNPCTMVDDKSQCVSNGNGYMCECDPGFAPDGTGGCIDERCVPNPCAATNEACRITNDEVECYTPDCDDQDPCTEDALVNGACQYDPIVCDDQNPCTDDTCDAAVGCTFTTDDTNVPDDGIACTTGACSGGFQSHTPDDALCDDGTFCNGPETCAPNDPMADGEGCLPGDAPAAPRDPSPCSYYGACDEGTDDFPLFSLGAGAACNDGLWCTENDLCDAAGNCTGVATAACDGRPVSCSATTPFPSTVDVPEAFLNIDVTVDGQPLPATASDGAGAQVYAVATDTGARHSIARWYWDFNGNLVGPDFAERLVPGVYDILYRKGESSNDPGRVFKTDSNDVGPNGLRTLQENVFVYAGQADLSVDVPQTDLSIGVTVDGQPLPATASDGAGAQVYMVSHDTGARHAIASWYWDFNGNLVGPNVAERLVPGTYDLLYRKGESSNDPGRVFQTDSNDVGPNGLRILQRDVVVSGSSTAIDIEIPQTDLTVNVTVAGQPLPPAATDGAGAQLYAVSHDTGARQSIASWYWDFNGNLVGPNFSERLVPGTYDILYRKGESSNDPGRVFQTDSNDVGPNGLRFLQRDVVVDGSATTVDVDVPETDLTIDVTVGGQSLPATASDGAGAQLYAVSNDTGARHSIATWYWDFNGNLVGPNFSERLVPGTYDLLYRKGESSNDPGRVFQTDSNDVGPNGLRLLQADVQISGGATTLGIDVPETPLDLAITVDGQALPATASDGAGAQLYAVSRDTGARHSIASWYWDFNGNLVGPNVTERLVPGTYDILYRKGEASNDPGRVFQTDSNDVGPNGLRYLTTVDVTGATTQSIAFDVPQSFMSFDVTVAGQSLPLTASDGAGTQLYAVARDTDARHAIANWYWDFNGNLVGPNFTERLVPGTYDILYRKGESSNDPGRVFQTDSNDVGPNGLRYLDVCVDVP